MMPDMPVSPNPEPHARVTGAILVIGDEILSGRTQDVNVQAIATFLAPLGISVIEVRFVPDVHADIVYAINQLRAKASYLFTTGGIGPTHDDITADAVADAFGVTIGEREDALALLAARYGSEALNAARRRMARIPNGASLINNPVSGAPGFQLGNVFVMAGVPAIMRGMLLDVAHRLNTAEPTQTITWRGPGVREGDIAEPLRALALEYPDLSFGSYPWFSSTQPISGGASVPVSTHEPFGTHIVIRGQDRTLLQRASQQVEALILQCNCPAVRVDP